MMETAEAKPTHRRYRPGEYFHYDFKYAAEESRSSILNGNYQDGELHSLLESRKSRLVMMENDLEDLLASQKLSKQAAWNRGEKWIEDVRVREKRITLAARIDVCKLEIDTLEEAIEQAEKEEAEKEIPPCLPNGPIGMNSVPGSIGRGYVDGQLSEHLGNAGLIIIDNRSPWRGMRVEDYIEHVVKPWKRASREYDRQRRKEDIAAGKKEESLPRTYKYPWPKWPACVKNHLKKEPSFRRTKFSKL